MKKELTSIGIFAILTLTAFSQTNKFQLGISGGPSVVSMGGDYYDKEDNEPVLSYSFGLTFDYNLTEKFSLATNLLYEKKGEISIEKYEFGQNGQTIGNDYLKTNFDYLTLPVLLKYSMGEKLKFHVNAGLYVGALLKGSYTTPSNLDLDWEITDEHNTWDFGVSFGGGISVPLSSSFALTVDLRQNMGLIDLAKDQNLYPEYKTVSSSLLIGIVYQFKKD